MTRTKRKILSTIINLGIVRLAEVRFFDKDSKGLNFGLYQRHIKELQLACRFLESFDEDILCDPTYIKGNLFRFHVQQLGEFLENNQTRFIDE